MGGLPARYEVALERTSTQTNPWYVVPSDRKWYRNWAIGRLLLEACRTSTRASRPPTTTSPPSATA